MAIFAPKSIPVQKTGHYLSLKFRNFLTKVVFHIKNLYKTLKQMPPYLNYAREGGKCIQRGFDFSAVRPSNEYKH